MPTIKLLADFDTDDYIVEPFGVKGLAELTLRTLDNEGRTTALFAYTPAAAQSLRNAAKRITESNGRTFTFEKLGREYREVSYSIARTLKNGTAKTINVTRRFLTVEAIRVTFVQNEADAAMLADDNES